MSRINDLDSELYGSAGLRASCINSTNGYNVKLIRRLLEVPLAAQGGWKSRRVGDRSGSVRKRTKWKRANVRDGERRNERCTGW